MAAVIERFKPKEDLNVPCQIRTSVEVVGWIIVCYFDNICYRMLLVAIGAAECHSPLHVDDVPTSLLLLLLHDMDDIVGGYPTATSSSDEDGHDWRSGCWC